MKKIIKISLLFLFALMFTACEKEVIKPVNDEVQQLNSSELSDENDSFTRSRILSVVSDDDRVTDPDEEEDFDEDDNVTDPDEEEDFDEDDNVTDPDEEEDFDEE